MNLDQNRALRDNARSLRANMTDQERQLWYHFLWDLPVHFRRQQIIGNYIVDFYCHAKRIVIELDGSQHYEESGQFRDMRRDAALTEGGFTVLRYSNADVDFRFSSVCEDILLHLGML